jgi:hypothetical protein
MFRLFRKKTKPAGQGTGIKDKIAVVLSKPLHQVQIRFANKLSKYDSRLSVRGRKWALLIFLVCMCSLSAYWLYEGIFPINGYTPVFLKHGLITQPKNTTLPDTLDIKWLQEYKRWRAKKDSLLDSLKR